jgi:DNA-binding transcriptional ArsR family regulator
MDEDKIVLDRKSFEALAVDTRVRILKSLRERRKTLTEISNEQDMSVSGIKEHLEVLEQVGLIKKIDDGHKWKYYELTKKGNEIVAPKEVKVLILLSTSIVALLASLLVMFSATAPLASVDSMETAMPAEDLEAPRAVEESADGLYMVTADAPAAESGAMNTNKAAPMEALRTEPVSEEIHGPDLGIAKLVAGISIVTILISLGILAKNRMR